MSADSFLKIVPNLRHRWPDKLNKYNDETIAKCYADFYYSVDAGNNDEKFEEWIEDMDAWS